MFDTMVASHAPGSRRARTVVISTSVAVHAIALTAVAIAAMWQIDKLALDPRGVTVPALSLPGDSGGGGLPQAAALVPKQKERPKVVPKDTVQPQDQVATIEKEVPVDTAPVTDQVAEGGLGGTIPGNGTGGDGRGVSTPTDGAGCKQPPCGAGTDDGTARPEKKKVTEPLVISPKVAAGLRTSGNDRIAAPDSVRAAMLRENKEKVTGTAKLCIGADGRIDRASMLKSTGYDAYDKKLLGEMRLWRYRPYRVDGVAAPACTVVTVIYVMQ